MSYSTDDINRMIRTDNIDGLIDALTSGSTIRNAAVKALAKIGEPAFEQVSAASKSSDDVLRRKICDVLGLMNNPDAIPILNKMLVDSDRYVRRRAANALINVGNEDSVIPLINALKDSESKVRLRAAEALGNIGDIRAIGPLVDLASQESYSDKEKVLNALNKIKWEPSSDENGAKYWITLRKWDKCIKIGAPAVNPLIEELNNSDSDVRNSTVNILVKIGDTAYSEILSASESSDKVVRRKCCDVFGLMGNPDAVPHLIRLLKDSDRNVRRRAANALIMVNNDAAVDALCLALKDSDSKVKSRSATALGVIGNKESIKNLVSILEDSDSEVKQKAKESLNKMGWNPGDDTLGASYHISQNNWEKSAEIGAPAVEPLIVKLSSSDSYSRNAAVQTLVKIGEPAFNSVVTASMDSDKVVRRKCSDVFGLMGNPDAVPHLIRLLKDSDSNVRSRAANALISVGDFRAVDPLISAMKDFGKIEIRSIKALGTIGDPRACSPLTKKLKESYSDEVKDFCAVALSNMGNLGVQTLIELLADKKPENRTRAALGLGLSGDSSAIWHLIAATSDIDAHVRYNSVVALGAIGDPRVIQPLMDALKDPNPNVRTAAAKSLDRLSKL